MNKNEIGFFAEEIPEKLIFAGKEVSFDEKIYRYAAAVAEFKPEAEKTIRKMENAFDSEIGYLDNFISEGGIWFYKKMSDLLDFSINQLSLNGCFSADKESFFKQYVAIKMEITPRIYDKMKAVYDDIRAKQAEKNAERVAKRKLNVAGGENNLSEMFFNGIARSFDGGKNILRAQTAYNDDVQEKIKQEFRYICRSMVDSFAEALWISEKIDLRNPVPAETYKRTWAMFENLKANKIPEVKIDDVAMEIFKTNPTINGFLDWAVSRYGDADGEMQKIADVFHISIAQTKNTLLKTTLNSLDFSSEESALKSKKIFEEKESALGLKIPEYEKKITEALITLERNSKVFDGQEFATRENALEARNQFNELKKMLLDSGFDSLDKVQNLLDQIDKKKFTISQAEEVKERLVVHQEILKTLPLKNIKFFRALLSTPGRFISFSLLIFSPLFFFFPLVWFLILAVFWRFPLSFFFKSKVSILECAKKYEKQKKYKKAALCYELAKPVSDPKYIGIEL